MAEIAAGIAISLAVSAATAGLTYALTPTQKISQGRLDSLLSANSSYGQPLPWAWGKVRLPGNRIWQDYLEETRDTKREGKTEITTFEYYGYFASLFCECPFRPIVDFQRIWMNKKLVYSTIGGAETIAEGGKFAEQYLRFYKGDAAQYLDPLLQHTEAIQNYTYGLPTDPEERDAYLASLGIDPATAILTPAYNYRSYYVAQRIPLTDFFNVLPTTEAEIIASENCTVGQIMGDIMSLFYESDRYDVSLLNDRVTGFTIDSVGAAKNAIQSLQQAYFFDIVYSNGVYKFIPLNHPRDVVELSRENLAAHVSGSKKPLDFEVIESDPTNLPSRVIVKYIDSDLNYDVNEQQSALEVKGHYNPNPTTLNFTIVMSGSQAATIADRALILAWIQRFTYKFQLPPALLALDPTDLVTNIFDDRDYPIKISKMRLGANLILDCEGVAHDNYFWDLVRVLEQGGVTLGVADYNVEIEVSGAVNTVADSGGTIYQEGTDYTIESNGNVSILNSGNIAAGTSLVISTTENFVQSSEDIAQIVSVGDSELLILDIPLIVDSDDDYTLYLAAGGGENWTGASIYISTDDSRYVFTSSFSSYSIYGDTVTNLDATDSFTVGLNKAELESVTDSDLALGFNLALVGNEIIQFKTAQLTDVNTYILSGLTRGLRGTEGEIDNHVIGDRFVLLQGDNALINKIALDSLDLGQTRYFKAVSAGQSLDAVTPIAITYQGIAQRPYAPTNLTATKNGVGDITIQWDRRDRHDQSENPLLSETTEDYRVEIINSADNSIVRTIATNISSSIYLATDQTADFGAIQSTITARIAQVSSSYGAGTATQQELIPLFVEPAPTLTGFTPASAQIGATITVTGTDLAQVSAIKIGDIEQDNLAVIDNQTISFEIASGTVSGLIELTTTGGMAISPNALILELPQTASGFPTSKKDISLPYLIDPTDFNQELIVNAETGVIQIPDLETGFANYWGCWISLDGIGSVTFERVSGGSTGIKQSNSLGNDDTVKLWHRGNNIWKID